MDDVQRPDWEFQVRPPATSDAEIRERHESNRAAWNEASAHYQHLVDDTIAFIRAGKSNLHPIERENLGDLKTWCRRAIHLQCAGGRDTLSLLNEGVQDVVGVDISEGNIDAATRTSTALGARAAWHRCDVLDTPASLDGGFDLVYTGRGAVGWVHDIAAWARVCFRLLRRGGVLSLLDDHPMSALFDWESRDLRWSGLGYFGLAGRSRGWPSSYIDDLDVPDEEQAWKFERLWTLGEITTAVADAGFVLELLLEHPETYWGAMPNLDPALSGNIPMCFSLLARKP